MSLLVELPTLLVRASHPLIERGILLFNNNLSFLEFDKTFRILIKSKSLSLSTELLN